MAQRHKRGTKAHGQIFWDMVGKKGCTALAGVWYDSILTFGFVGCGYVHKAFWYVVLFQRTISIVLFLK